MATKLRNLIKRGFGKRTWIIQDLIPQGELAILYAPTNTFKTFMAVKIALEVATGGQELGATKYGKVFIYSPDTAADDLILRIRALANLKYLNQKETILENLYLDFDEIDFTSNGHGLIDDQEEYVTDNGYYTSTKYRDIKRLKTWEEFGDSFCWDSLAYNKDESIACGLLIIDTLSQSIGKSGINDDAAIRLVIKNLKQILKGSFHFSSILLIAHAGKNGSRGIMGTSIQKNDVPTILTIKNKKNGRLELFREKIKSKTEGSSIPFKMREAVIDEQESLYVDIGMNLSPIENEILNHSKNGLTKEATREVVYKLGISNATTKKSFNVVFNRAWKNLIDSGFIKEGNKETT